MKKNIQAIQTQAALMQKLQDETQLFALINELKNQKEVLQSLIEQYNIDLEQFQPVNFLRYHVLQLLQQGENITAKLVKQVKEDIESGNVAYFYPFGFEPELLQKLTVYKKDKKRSIFSSWQHKGKLNYFSIFHIFFYRKIELEKTNVYLTNIGSEIKKQLNLEEEHKIKTFTFQGIDNLGSTWAGIAIFPNKKNTPQKALQLLFRVDTEGVQCGIFRGSAWQGEAIEPEFKNFSHQVNIAAIIDFLKLKKHIYLKINGLTQNEPYTNQDALKELFLSEVFFEQIKKTLQYKQNIILQGSAGVGKTFLAKRLAFAIMGERDESRIKMIQFHQTFGYEDFMQGIKPNIKGEFHKKNGIFYEFCQTAQQDLIRPYFFIIDEINRGNISKIFGETLMLVEKDKRSEKYALQLPYQEEDDLSFYIPKNVYLIGTMNTSDRSLAWLDYALRRRFAFVEIEPQFNEKFCQHLQKQGVTEGGVNMILEKINVLNQEIQRDINLGKNFMIGHSYFCQFDATIFDDENEWFKYVLQYEIEPLLREYWFDDESKVKRVLEN